MQGLQDDQTAPRQSQLIVEGTQHLLNAWSGKEVKHLVQVRCKHERNHTTKAERDIGKRRGNFVSRSFKACLHPIVMNERSTYIFDVDG